MKFEEQLSQLADIDMTHTWTMWQCRWFIILVKRDMCCLQLISQYNVLFVSVKHLPGPCWKNKEINVLYGNNKTVEANQQLWWSYITADITLLLFHHQVCSWSSLPWKLWFISERNYTGCLFLASQTDDSFQFHSLKLSLVIHVSIIKMQLFK